MGAVGPHGGGDERLPCPRGSAGRGARGGAGVGGRPVLDAIGSVKCPAGRVRRRAQPVLDPAPLGEAAGPLPYGLPTHTIG